MQKKTIKKNVSAKLREWIATISDEQLRDDLKDNVMVSGGCIASLFLGEDVNDYDVYIKDMDVLKRLTEYYCKPFGKDLEVIDGREWLGLLSAWRGDYGDKEDDQYSIAVKNTKDDQIKIFVSGDKGGYRVDPLKLAKTKDKYKPAFFSPNAISLTDDLQIVIRFSGNHEEIHKNFDFIHATNYFTFEDGVVTNLPAMESLMTRQLQYQGSLYPLTSIIRSRKFIKRHWNIGAGEYLKIMFQISQLDLTDIDVLEDQLIGVDVAYFSSLIRMLRKEYNENNNFKLDNSKIVELINKVFND